MAQAQLQSAFERALQAKTQQAVKRRKPRRVQLQNSGTPRTRLRARQILSNLPSNVRRRNMRKTRTASKNMNLAVNRALRNNVPVSRVLISNCENTSNSNDILNSEPITIISSKNLDSNLLKSSNVSQNESINVASSNSLISTSIQTAPSHTLLDNLTIDSFSDFSQLLGTNNPGSGYTSALNVSAAPQLFSTNLSLFLILFTHIFDVFFVPQLLVTFCSTQAPSISAMKIFLYRDFLFSDFYETIQREQQVRLSSASNPSALTIDRAFELFLTSSRKLGFTYL